MRQTKSAVSENKRVASTHLCKQPIRSVNSQKANACIHPGRGHEDGTKCHCCVKENNKLSECCFFVNKENKEKMEVIRKHSLCFRCMQQGHTSRDCSQRSRSADCLSLQGGPHEYKHLGKPTNSYKAHNTCHLACLRKTACHAVAGVTIGCNQWIIDSGTTWPHGKWQVWILFVELATPIKVKHGAGHQVDGIGCGNVYLKIQVWQWAEDMLAEWCAPSWCADTSMPGIGAVMYDDASQYALHPTQWYGKELCCHTGMWSLLWLLTPHSFPHKDTMSLGLCTLQQTSPKCRLKQFACTISHVQGKAHIVSDALSRAPAEDAGAEIPAVEDFTRSTMEALPISDNRILAIKKGQETDEKCQLLKDSHKGWPHAPELPAAPKPYYEFTGEITINDNLLMWGTQLTVPSWMRCNILEHLHKGHLGMTTCKSLVKDTVWWPSNSQEIE